VNSDLEYNSRVNLKNYAIFRTPVCRNFDSFSLGGVARVRPGVEKEAETLRRLNLKYKFLSCKCSLRRPISLPATLQIKFEPLPLQ
jgi:hypothetical protein